MVAVPSEYFGVGRFIIPRVYWGKSRTAHDLFVEVTENGDVRVTKGRDPWGHVSWEVVTNPFDIEWLAFHPHRRYYRPESASD